MAEDVKLSSRWKKNWITDIVTAFGLDVVVAAAITAFRDRAGKAIGEKAAKTLVDDDRGNLLKDFLSLKKPQKEKLIERHKKAIEACKENRFITLLCKIPKDEHGSRRPVLVRLSNLDDKAFDQMLELLENDALAQFARRILLMTGPRCTSLMGWLKHTGGKISPTMEKAGNVILPALARMADLAESLPGAKPTKLI